MSRGAFGRSYTRLLTEIATGQQHRCPVVLPAAGDGWFVCGTCDTEIYVRDGKRLDWPSLLPHECGEQRIVENRVTTVTAVPVSPRSPVTTKPVPKPAIPEPTRLGGIPREYR